MEDRMVELKEANLFECLVPIKPGMKNVYGEGDWSLLDNDRTLLAIIGSRKMTGRGKEMVESLVPGLVRAGVVIVSGFMCGVDMTAHESCVANGGKTIAVLGWGIETERKHNFIVESGGLVLSEWKDDLAKPWMFAHRDRVVAGMCQAVLVVEAAINSGSLITANLAIKFGKKLLAVPSYSNSEVSIGVNGLIERGEAISVTKVDEILKNLMIE